MKIGIFPGSYDPIHNDHIKIINELLNKKIIDKIILIPLENYWDKKITSNLKDRIKMLKLISNEKIIIKENLENSYAYQIINEIKKEHKNIYYIIGADNLETLNKWKNVEEVLKENFIVINRNNIDVNQMLKNNNYDIDKFTIINLTTSLSSTNIRKKINNKEDVKEYLDKKIYNYIKENNLYEGGN